MLRSISISRFKSIYEQKIEFGRVNIFIGGNGSGKSNLLEAIGIVSSAVERGLALPDLERKGVRLSTAALFKSAFKSPRLPRALRLVAQFDGKVEYSFELTASQADVSLRFASEALKFRRKNLLGRSGRGITLKDENLRGTVVDDRSLWDQVRSIFEAPEAVTRELNQIARYAIYSPQTAFLRGEQVASVQSPPLGLHGEGLPQAVSGVLRQLHNSSGEVRRLYRDIIDLVWLPGWARQFAVGQLPKELLSPEVKTGEQTLFFLDKFAHPKRNKMSAYDSSEGTLFLLFVAVLLMHQNAPRIFSLDNVDNALNPALTTKVISKIINVVTGDEFRSENIGPEQVFMTSHNPTSLDAFDLFNEEQRVFVVKRDDEGRTIVERLRPPPRVSRERWVEISGGRSLSELWISGKIPGALGAEY